MSNKKYEASTYGSAHEIKSANTLHCAETDRVIAVFYNESDLNDVIDCSVDYDEYARRGKALESAATRQRMALSNARLMMGSEAKAMPNWIICRNLFGLGMVSATELCVELGVDPDGY